MVIMPRPFVACVQTSPISFMHAEKGAYDVLFGLSTLISNRILFHNLCEIEYLASGTLEHD